MHSQHTHRPCQWPVACSSEPADPLAAGTLPFHSQAGKGNDAGWVACARRNPAHRRAGAVLAPARMPALQAMASQKLSNSCVPGLFAPSCSEGRLLLLLLLLVVTAVEVADEMEAA